MGNSKEFKSNGFLDELEPSKICHFHEGILAQLNGDEDKYYSVSGVIYQHDVSTQLNFCKTFSGIDSAKKYLLEMAKKNPISEIIIKEIIERELYVYI